MVSFLKVENRWYFAVDWRGLLGAVWRHFVSGWLFTSTERGTALCHHVQGGQEEMTANHWWCSYDLLLLFLVPRTGVKARGPVFPEGPDENFVRNFSQSRIGECQFCVNTLDYLSTKTVLWCQKWTEFFFLPRLHPGLRWEAYRAPSDPLACSERVWSLWTLNLLRFPCQVQLWRTWSEHGRFTSRNWTM